MGILDFDAGQLNDLLDAKGLRKAWLSILATHVQDETPHSYILDSPEFRGVKRLDTGILGGLTIGEIGVLYEYSSAYIDHASRKSNGQFFTPDDVANFMCNFSEEFPEGKWLDPCSGIGNLTWHLASKQKNPEKFLRDRVILSDRDELALLIARTLLTISFQKRNKNLFNEIKENFIHFDFLSVADSGVGDLFSNVSALNKIPKHDFVIVNPPYLSTQIDGRFETSKSGDLFSYFLENIIKTSKGFISITPQSFTNAAKFRSLRKLFIQNFENVRIYTFDNVPGNIFKGIKFGSQNSNTANSIRAAITVALPGAGKFQITPLIRWKSDEREKLFSASTKLLGPFKPSEDFFPKVGKPFAGLYKETLSLPKLGSIVSSSKTPYALYIPSAPRYFIPALLKPVSRSSQKVIYFKNEEDRDKASIVINSSLMYWWWRVRDGGMTLSTETLLSCPLPHINVSKALMKELIESEKNNKVYKKNAGAEQENVKHPPALLLKLNRIVAPKHAEQLLDLHRNSDI